jgi:iron complex outermembrane receptor protein
MRSCLLFLLFVLLAGTQVRGQQTLDTIALHNVVIVAPRLSDFASGLKTQAIDSATMARYRSADLGTLLEMESPIFIKSYGLGSLASSSFRGGSANHTAVLWNGFNIGGPMNGQIDLSLVPVGIADEVSIQYGGASALWGSGAVGGSVLLNSTPVFDSGLTVDAGASFGSFGDRRQHFHFVRSTSKWISSISLFNTAARNDFLYSNPELLGTPEQRQRNAELAQYGLLAENHFRIDQRQRLSLRFWYQNSDRNIPPILAQANSSANQQDQSYRATAEWQRLGTKVNSYVRAAYFDERLQWYGTSTDSAANSRSRTLIAEAEMRIRIARGQRINIGLNNTYAEARADGFPERQQQNRTALFASYRINTANERSNTTLSLRQEMVAQELVPFTWSLGSEYALRNWLTAKANVARVYRIPTFNDLYWTPGGNPDLLPESGYSGELGLAAKGGLRSGVKATAEGTFFQRTMDNWIIWLPAGAYWSPQNIMNVWSRGVELRGELAWRMGGATMKLAAMTNYVVSTNQTAKTVNDASVDKQLIYVPIYSGHGKLSVRYKGLLATAGVNYTGYRYTSTDNREYLDPYVLVNASVSYRMSSCKKYIADLMLQGFNLFDADYQVMLGRPMPLRNFQIGLSVRFNQANSTPEEQP